MRFLSKVGHWARAHGRNLLKLDDQIAEAKILAATALINQTSARGLLPDIREAEFKVSSQFGEDGIIQYLTRRTGISVGERRFIEFGVESYAEANTRFLLVNANWQGLVIDGSSSNIDAVRGSRCAMLNAICRCASQICKHT